MGINASKDGTEDNNDVLPDPSTSLKYSQSAHADDANRRIVNDEVIVIGDEDSNAIPTVFKWEHGGRNVYITGTFNNWAKQIQMHRSGNDFSYVHNLKRGKHAYRFVVDDEWRFAPDQPTVADIEGRINNFIDISEFQPYIGDDNFFEKSKERKIPNEDFHQNIPELDEYTKEPPALPPHLRHIILNKSSPSIDPLALPVPQHVSLNHLYCTAIKDGMMVLGATQRYREKYYTVVFYSVMPGTKP